MTCAVYIPVGPSDREIFRAADVIDSVVAYSDALRWIIVVDDGHEGRGIKDRLNQPPACEVVVLRNPRNGAGNGWHGGMCVSTLVALEYIVHATTASFALKLDTDSLVIGRFDGRIQHAISAHADAGMFGVIGDSVADERTYKFMEQNRRVFEASLRIGDDYSLLTPRALGTLRRWGVASETEFSHFLQARRLLEAAIGHGYSRAEYCQGGGYVVTRPMLEVMAAIGSFDNPLLWCTLNINEDVMMGLFCAATGFRMYDLSGVDQVFTVEGPLPFSPQQLTAMNTSVIHSIKGVSEDEFRRFFRAQRFAWRARPDGVRIVDTESPARG